MKRSFARCILCFIASSVLMASCKKGAVATSYYLSATINGNAKSFNESQEALFWDYYSIGSLGVAGSTDKTNQEELSLGVNNLPFVQLVPGTYYDTASTYDVVCTYTQDKNTEYMVGVSASGPYRSPKNEMNPFKVIIASIDSVAIKGSFSGNLYLNGDTSQVPFTITDGRFYVPIRRP